MMEGARNRVGDRSRHEGLATSESANLFGNAVAEVIAGKMRQAIVYSCLLLLTRPLSVFAQEPSTETPRTRAEAIADDRAAKVAELWPERESPMVDIANNLGERGFQQGVDSGQGPSGAQLVMGGMRTGQGFTVGAGYRRSDFWGERLGYRATARASPQLAYMLDFDLDFQGLRTARTSLQWYTKFERSPNIDYYGLGNESSPEKRTTFLYSDFTTDFSGAYVPVRFLHVGVTGGYLHAHTAQGSDDLPPINDVFPSESLPGFELDTKFTRIGAFAYVDTRDSPRGPRSGGLYGVRYREYWDVDRKAFAFRQAEFEFQQYLPYFNRSRVVALHALAVLSFPKEGDSIPLYLQPTVGGDDNLRGFAPYRFRDFNALNLAVEHRWHVSSLLEMSAFADAGKVAQFKEDLNLSGLHYDGGLGLRVRLGSAVVTRIEVARSGEGWRAMWTFDDIFQRRW